METHKEGLMRNRIFKMTAIVAVLAVALIVPASQQSLKAAQNTSASLKLELLGTSSFIGAGVTAAPSGLDDYVRAGDEEVNREIPALSYAPARVPSDHVPTPAGLGIASSNPGLSGFNGLTHRDQRLAGTGDYTNTQ